MDLQLSKTGLEMVFGLLVRIFRHFEVWSILHKITFLHILGVDVKNSKYPKNRSRGRKNILSTVLESLEVILSISKKIFGIWVFLKPQR